MLSFKTKPTCQLPALACAIIPRKYHLQAISDKQQNSQPILLYSKSEQTTIFQNNSENPQNFDVQQIKENQEKFHDSEILIGRNSALKSFHSKNFVLLLSIV